MRLPVLAPARVAACALAALALALPAQADECRDRIAGMFFGGALDPTQRPHYRLVVDTLKADGSYARAYEVIWAAVDQAMTIQNGMYILMRGEQSWLGNSADGPWTLSPPSQPMNAIEGDKQRRAQMQANLSDTSCDGMYEIEGKQVERFTFRTMMKDEAQGTYYGALYTAYVDPATNLLMRQDSTETVAHYAPTPSQDRDIQQYFYDPSLTLPDPQ